MKFATTSILALLMAEQVAAFAPSSPLKTNSYKSKASSSSSTLSMALDVDPAQVAAPAVPVEQPGVQMVVKSPGGGPTDVRYSEFLKLVDADKIEKVTFSSDGTQLLGVDVDGTRLKIQSLPNDPDLLSQLTTHKVRPKKPSSSMVGRNSLHCTHTFSNLSMIYYFFDRSMSPFFHSKKPVDSATLPSL